MPRSTPFGSDIKSRGYSAEKYRFGFNNQEKDGELGDAYAFEYRIHDARLGRWLAVDPMLNVYVSQSPYCYTRNSINLYKEIGGKNYQVIYDNVNKTITINAQFKIIKSDDLSRDEKTKQAVNEAIAMYNSAKDIEVKINEDGNSTPTTYKVSFALTLVESEDKSAGPLNTIQVKSDLDVAAVSSEAAGYCSDNKIVIAESYNDKVWSVTKHEIGHALGMPHEEGKGYLMSEEVTTNEVNLGIENIKSSLGRVGIGDKRQPIVSGEEGDGQIVRINGPIFEDAEKMKTWKNALETAKIDFANGK